MSCGSPHETDCGEVLARVSTFLDHTLGSGSPVDYSAIEQHLRECQPCLDQYGVEVEELQAAVRAVLQRCCGHEHAPDELRLRVVQRIRVSVTRETP
ncbi:MAG: mycothiol system anti-sigma-R factor [Jiangellales bacterium]|jgi:anti-sigma factor (TIGR02949 family)